MPRRPRAPEDQALLADDVSALAMPFYLAHPLLERLEDTQAMKVEGDEHESCMRILRRETGHTVDNACRPARSRSLPPLLRRPSDGGEHHGHSVHRSHASAVPQWVEIYQYTNDQRIEDDGRALIQTLELRLALSEDQACQELAVILTVQAMNHLHSGSHRLVL
jgi:hypothetical protein